MKTICGANCAECPMTDRCPGCAGTCGKPFSGRCIAAETIRNSGAEAYRALKETLLREINALLPAFGYPETQALCELPGSYVNPEYELPGGAKAKFLKDEDIYLGCQVEPPVSGPCIGAVACEGFLLLCSYGENGRDPKLLLFRKR